MWFWWFLFVCNLLIPAAMIVGGYLMHRHCPHRISGTIGYRTQRSMKNMETWRFAHIYCGRLWQWMGWIQLVPTVLVQLPFYRSSSGVIGTVGIVIETVQLAVLVTSVIVTEQALRREFTDDGVRRNVAQ